MHQHSVTCSRIPQNRIGSFFDSSKKIKPSTHVDEVVADGCDVDAIELELKLTVVVPAYTVLVTCNVVVLVVRLLALQDY